MSDKEPPGVREVEALYGGVGDMHVEMTLGMEVAKEINQRLDRIEAKLGELLAGGQKRQPRNMHDKTGSE